MEFSPEKEKFFEKMADQSLALTFDDVRMRTAPGDQAPLPEELDLSSQFSRNVEIKLPFISAAMDTVTEAPMAIEMAKAGGLGVIHAGLDVKSQRNEVRKVKYELTGLIEDPVGYNQDASLEYILDDLNKRELEFRTLLVKGDEEKLVGVLTSHDFEVAKYSGVSVTAKEAMTPISDMVYAPAGTSLQEAHKIMINHKKIKTVPLVNEDDTIAGLYLWRNVDEVMSGDAAKYNLDSKGRLRVAAAVPTSEQALERIEAMQGYLDVAVIDSADGDSYYAFQTLKEIKAAYPDLDVVAGNISEGESAKRLVDAGADGIKVGQGPGSICSTRRETGIGMPQVTAVYECVKAIKGSGVPVCADGGIVEHGDINIAIASGAHSVMMGKMLAATDKAPGDVVPGPGGAKVKLYRGMGSPSAIRDNGGQRYGGKNALAEGVEAFLPYNGEVSQILELCTKALIKGMRYAKAPSIDHMRTQALLIRITNAGLRESHPHDVDAIT